MFLPSMDQLYCLLTIKCLFLVFEVALNDEHQFDLCKTRFSTSKLQFIENKPHRLSYTLSRSSSQTPLFPIGSKAVMGPSPQSNNSQAQQGQGYIFREIKGPITEKLPFSVYYAFFQSHLEFGIQLWGHPPDCHRLLFLQNKTQTNHTSAVQKCLPPTVNMTSIACCKSRTMHVSSTQERRSTLITCETHFSSTEEV